MIASDSFSGMVASALALHEAPALALWDIVGAPTQIQTLNFGATSFSTYHIAHDRSKSAGMHPRRS